MSTLHMVSRQLDDTTLQSLERALSTSDGLLLSCDAVYLACKPGYPWKLARLYALEADVQARGLLELWPREIALINHHGLVELCVEFDKSLSWS